jgi:hypothetical protein
MPRPVLSRISSFYHNYIQQVPQDNLMNALDVLSADFLNTMETIPASKHEYAYAAGKWTLKEVFQHIIDTERILSYRALCIARGETQSLPGFDENTYAANSKALNRNWEDMVAEFKALRSASKFLFGSFDEQQMEKNGIANNNPTYVLALGFVVAGHCQHHLAIIKDRYL